MRAILTAALALVLSIAPPRLAWAETTPNGAQQEDRQSGQALGAPADTRRVTIAPWSVKVLGQNFENFTNEGAAQVLIGWLTNALIDIRLFNIVNREDLEQVLDEISLRPYAAGQEVRRGDLAQAGKLLSADYILLGKFINLGSKSEIDFKLLDVETSTYSEAFSMQFEVPFNPGIESSRAVLGRVVAGLSNSFPTIVDVRAALSPTHLVIEAGRQDGLDEFHQVELLRPGRGLVSRGVVVSVSDRTAEVELERPIEVHDVGALRAQIRVAPGAEAILALAGRRLAEGRDAEARQILADARERYPGHSRLHAEHARLSRRQYDYDEALRSFRAALDLAPNDLSLLEDAVGAFLEAGDYSEVLRRLAPRERTARMSLVLGRAYEILGYERRARDEYKEALRRDPTWGEPHCRLALLSYRVGDLDDAGRELEAALRDEPPSLESQLISYLVQAIGSGQGQLVDLDPWIKMARSRGAFAELSTAAELLLAESDLWPQAKHLAEASLAMNPSYFHAKLLLAESQARSGDIQGALDSLDRTLLESPGKVVLLLQSARFLERAGQLELAEQRLLQAKDLAPDLWRPADRLGDFAMQRDRHLEAVREYRSALDIATRTDEPDLVPRLYKLGRAAAIGGQFATAQPYLERCVDGAPDHLECRFYLGLCYFAAEVPEHDTKAIVSFRASDASIPDSLYYLGQLYERRAEYAAAVEWYARCVAERCDSATEAQTRIDVLESIQGTVTAVSAHRSQVSLDIGRIHGLSPRQLLTVLSGRAIRGTLLLTEVREDTSVAKVKKGKPLVGYTVRLRPARPKGLEVRPASGGRGLILEWEANEEPEVVSYQISRKASGSVAWEKRGRAPRTKPFFHDKGAKTGVNYSYRVSAVSRNGQQSLPTTTAASGTQ